MKLFNVRPRYPLGQLVQINSNGEIGAILGRRFKYASWEYNFDSVGWYSENTVNNLINKYGDFGGL
jgi:hypothetical protein